MPTSTNWLTNYSRETHFNDLGNQVEAIFAISFLKHCLGSQVYGIHWPQCLRVWTKSSKNKKSRELSLAWLHLVIHFPNPIAKKKHKKTCRQRYLSYRSTFYYHHRHAAFGKWKGIVLIWKPQSFWFRVAWLVSCHISRTISSGVSDAVSIINSRTIRNCPTPVSYCHRTKVVCRRIS